MASKNETASSPRNDGRAMIGQYSLNHRRRAEELATAGKTTDPDKVIGDELIADAKGRLAAQAKAAKAAENTPSTDKES